ncbi:20073_t:CDS:2 [Dentiscutata erythropus]|uniref:20073_t:CDS:1 n=1 Tax=Dentiscutata erythropus TaxID=1348616 RepID=A0A9N8VUW2_9GLOM|nr:20073_t:CDS:2 [Dentiscutata erythropus]
MALRWKVLETMHLKLLIKTKMEAEDKELTAELMNHDVMLSELFVDCSTELRQW